MARFIKGQTAWNKGLTKEDPRVLKYVISQIGVKRSEATRRRQSLARIGKHPWNYGVRGLRYGPWTEERKAAARKLAIENMGRIVKSDTLPERLVESVLIKLGLIVNVDYFKQVPLCGVTKADFYVKKWNIVLLVDGCWWHACSLHKPDRPNKERIIEKDERTNRILRENGYNVFRIWEHDIKSENGIERYKLLLQSYGK
jgi:DNA mismatch endonuclease (patch repair protein)